MQQTHTHTYTVNTTNCTIVHFHHPTSYFSLATLTLFFAPTQRDGSRGKALDAIARDFVELKVLFPR